MQNICALVKGKSAWIWTDQNNGTSFHTSFSIGSKGACDDRTHLVVDW